MRRDPRIVIGLLLVLAGLLFGLQEMNVISGDWEDPLFLLAFAVGMFFFLMLFSQDRSRWWAALGGLILLGLTLTQLLAMFLPSFADAYGGVLFMGVMGIAFFSVYVIDRHMWWAIIPGGVMASLAIMLLVDALTPALPIDSAGILFIGMGLTFLAISFMTVGGERMSWALFPALPLLVLGLVVGLQAQAVWDYVWPGLIVLAGLYFLITSLRAG